MTNPTIQTTTDTLLELGHGSLLQHGKHNDRIYLMKVHPGDEAEILTQLNQLAEEQDYGKLFCKIPQHLVARFQDDGFTAEAIIPDFYQGREDAFFMARYRHAERAQLREQEQLQQLRKLFATATSTSNKRSLPQGYTLRQLTPEDAEPTAAIYQQVFASYPFPIFDPEYIRQTMADNVMYFGAEQDGKLVALSSSEIDFKGGNAEMTDFSTLPGHLGKGLSLHLLEYMEREMLSLKIKTLYTIARLNSLPMNKTFLRRNYRYAGTLIQNTNIAGQLESMNLYYKQL
ncbi:putative beta-lysine N-acetyltransferase [Mangrovibacterium marinum]|uniref:Beta-lysine acetyltransferase n=1 Tax=Mangrovibacterium marinum TaxID=1639118 RepID=A0A2T5BXR9_9BACT|nr:putative beta-lysine N-acetyltransferase [Mangrovibacterium marinum]PTN05945.1 beta-lysine acetyltransferase [Mangrovibacterium marinum]